MTAPIRRRPSARSSAPTLSSRSQKLDLSDEEAVTQIVDALYKWRDTHSDPNQRRK